MSSTDNVSQNTLVIAVPVAQGRLCMHFGHCEQFALYNVDTATKEIASPRRVVPPPHEPGLLPRWLHDQGVKLVIAGGMGGRAQGIFEENGIEVIVGAPAELPEDIIRRYLDGQLQPGENACDH